MKTLKELAAALREAQVAFEAATAEEREQKMREFENARAAFETAKAEAEAQRENQPQRNPEAILREVLKGAREDKQAREITLLPVSGKTGANIKASGAIELEIKDIIPTLNEGLGLPGSLHMVTGVTGDVLYPYGIDDAEMEEVGENSPLTDQELHFDNIKVTPGRTGLSITVSNAAIDNAAFDLMGYVRGKFGLALKKYLAKKIYSQAAWTGIKGAFSGLTAAGTITLDKNAYKNILKVVAEFADKGLDASKVCFVMDAVTEADLKATVKAEGQGGFLIENGKLCGYDYVVTHLINTTFKGGSGADKYNLVPTADRYLGVGFFEYEALQQHGLVRMTVDATSKAVAIKNETAIVLNTAYSITDLSVKVNGGNGKSGADATQAFALYKIAQPAA